VILPSHLSLYVICTPSVLIYATGCGIVKWRLIYELIKGNLSVLSFSRATSERCALNQKSNISLTFLSHFNRQILAAHL
ncbi:hypothetical protein, partial [Hafnia alvei]|uniref:hypothetical protein n=1 Tax=Hafnia alvei TaxID=569 RepID=UPI001B3B31A9